MDKLNYLKSLNDYSFVSRNTLLAKGISFGCEIEVNNLSVGDGVELVENFNYGLELWERYNYDDHETTVDFEVITAILLNDEMPWKNFKLMLDMLKAHNAKISSRASGHIHVGSDRIDDENKLINLLKILCVFEPIIFKFGYNQYNNPSAFHYCNKDYRRTLTRVMNPIEVDSLVKTTETDEFNKSIFFRKYLEFIHSDIYYRPVFNFRNFNFFQFIDIETHTKILKSLNKNKSWFSNFIYPVSDHIEFRCFNGSLSQVIWQNNVDLVTRIIYAVDSGTIDLDFIDYEFSKYRKKRYSFYEDVKGVGWDNILDCYEKYNEHLLSYSKLDINLAFKFAEMFYSDTLRDERARLHFLKQYFKIFNDYDMQEINCKQKTL